MGLALDEAFEHGEVVGLLLGGTAHGVGVMLTDERRFGVRVHPRSVERALRRQEKNRR